jgi:hypothetical protein
MTERVEVTISMVMTEDRDQQNALALNMLTHMAEVADRFGVVLGGGETWARVDTVTAPPGGEITVTLQTEEP